MFPRARFALLLGGVCLATPALADEAACKVVGDAMVKMAGTPARETVSYENGANVLKSEVVKTADKMYVQVRGTWVARPYDSQKEAAEAREKLKSANAQCTREGGEALDGEAADRYLVQTTLNGVTTDMKLWIATASGLPIRVVGTQGDGKAKSEVRLAYDKVVPPAGVQ